MDPNLEPANFRRADELRWASLRALDGDRTLCVCAVSALEVHGPHLPIGADLHQAAWMADETGRRFAAAHPEWTVLLHPPLPIGADELPLPGSIDSPPRVVYRAVVALGESLARAGFRTVMVTNAHGGPRHAAALEGLAGSIGWLRNAKNGYGRPAGTEPVSWSGWPAVAAADLGRAYAELSVRACLADLDAVVTGRVRAAEIRSIASDPPFLQPNFWRWLAAGGGAAAFALRALL